ncbi:MAG: DUF1501 domain-containing protein [Planctomycetaceae bacterium]|nr:DUF1501 domain-containing protein [Planctomycetaceae bacterium]MCB9951177.1 DUF1501 domain-containing protein [Planctomycetaceae bacterium]
MSASHSQHAFSHWNPLRHDGVTVLSRRNMLKAGMGLAGLSLPALLQARANGAGETPRRKSVILLWMTGGPSHIDMWDMKPQRPIVNRGPFSPISTNVPGISICEHLPKQAAMMDRFTVIRSVDCRKSNHQPNQVMQTGSRDAGPRVNPKGDRYPAIGSIVAKHYGANHPAMPPYVVFQKHPTHVAWGGWLGKEFDPFDGNQAAVLPQLDLVGKSLNTNSGGDLFHLPVGLNHARLEDRRGLARQFDRIQQGLDQRGSMDAIDAYSQQAFDMVLGREAQRAFDLTREDPEIRQRYGDHLWCQQALLAARLVEAGVSYVTIDLSYHTASGTWDNHGDNIPPYGGISRGLKPLLPLFDHLLTTLVGDLEQRGLLDECLVIAMGEFGRTPNMGTQESTDGRNHWPVVMSMSLAGGGLRHGQVIGSTTPDGGEIASRPVTPGDLAATIYRHFGVPIDVTYEDERNRPRYAVEENGQPIAEIF